ncbi:unnamed protein product [Nippostrongylus brasiliensis]|uniref:Aldedh domain-containing protein n=1 Tax=Nippostrongylus brasiliensis TaxID=27835 RepID=A0A0N4YVS6_NIPBR|nr:unnamed protein product [Nippostrongylus brasiliensis]
MQNRICELLSDSGVGKERKLEIEVIIEAISQAEEAWTATRWERVMSPDAIQLKEAVVALQRRTEEEKSATREGEPLSDWAEVCGMLDRSFKDVINTSAGRSRYGH